VITLILRKKGSKKKLDVAGHGGTYLVPALGRLRQEDHEFENSLTYAMRPYLKKRKRKRKNWMPLKFVTIISWASEMNVFPSLIIMK
jgi:hypothetical protein